MKRAIAALGALALLGSVVLIAQAPPTAARPTADPKTPVFWTAAQMKAIDQRAATRVSPTTNMAGEALLASASVIYRTGNSQAEAHEKLADFIFVREGGGSIIVGGRILGGQPSGAGEIRGDSIDSGTRYEVAAGDTLYIPANTPHQFFVEPGKHWVITIVKITPKE